MWDAGACPDWPEAPAAAAFAAALATADADALLAASARFEELGDLLTAAAHAAAVRGRRGRRGSAQFAADGPGNRPRRARGPGHRPRPRWRNPPR